jgi:tetratricopeptide (TPR) repeat protein
VAPLARVASWRSKTRRLDLQAPDDRFGRGACVGQLGLVAYERFKDARTAERPVEELARHLAEAARLYEQALDMMPATAVTERGIVHNQLGIIYSEARDIDLARHHYQQSIQYADKAGDIFEAGRRRFNAAMTLLRADRLTDARAYAEAALANFRTFSDRAADHIQKTERLIAGINQAIAKKAGGA